jgi:hypothetical protein
MNYIGNDPAPAGLILVGDTNPVGLVGWFHAPPDGSWVHLNGQVLVKANYPDLWAYAQGFLTADQVVNPGLYRSIDASTFAVPNLAGLFIRSTGGNAPNAAAALGVKQADELKAHTHTTVAFPSTGATSTFPAAGSNATIVSATGSTGGVETRPANVALVPCVKALRSVLMPASAMPTPAVEFLGEKNAASSANLDFVGLAGYTGYRFLFQNLIPASNADTLIAQLSSNNGSSFDTAAVYGYALGGVFNGTHTVVNQGLNSVASFNLASSLSNAAGHGATGELLLSDLQGAARSAITYGTSHSVYWHSAGYVGQLDGAQAYTPFVNSNAIRFKFGAGNIVSGRISAYGYRRA